MDLDECNCTAFGLSIYAYIYLYMRISNNNTSYVTRNVYSYINECNVMHCNNLHIVRMFMI